MTLPTAIEMHVLKIHYRKSSCSLSFIFVRKSAELDFQYEEDVDELEWVQQRVTEMLIGLESVTCRERLKKLALFSPENKSFSGSNISLNVLKRLLIQPKCMAGEWETMIINWGKVPIGSKGKIHIMRVLKHWNRGLPEVVVESLFLEIFKIQLAKAQRSMLTLRDWSRRLDKITAWCLS